ncbi:acyl-CoA/acyl-ACP dehydrogenase [Thermoleophilia bacterium SCSIO 60948]|nr:acyl-CoA/acyl-ACP dehydrogenase [Thermoleophilia bacterium SCSIO 60948]
MAVSENPERGTREGSSDLAAATERFVADEVLPDVAAWDEADELPDSAVARMVELGLPGALVPPGYGGAGLSVSEMVPVWRALSRGWISLTGSINPTALGTVLLVRHGTDRQRDRWLPAIAQGDALASFSITEPQAGSDLRRIETSARRHPDGGLVLDGDKRWVAGGASSAVIFMLAVTGADERPSCLVLPAEGRGEEGWIVGELDKIGYRGVSSSAYRFDGFHAAGAEILGGEEGEGHGVSQMLGALEVGRINVACRGLGIIDRALARAVEECGEREIGSGLLGDHTHAQLRLGEMVARRLAAESLTERAALAVDAGADDAAGLATSAKLITSETAVWAVDRAARLAASRSYTAGEELARLRRDAPQTQIGEGANDALCMALARPLLEDGTR